MWSKQKKKKGKGKLLLLLCNYIVKGNEAGFWIS